MSTICGFHFKCGGGKYHSVVLPFDVSELSLKRHSIERGSSTRSRVFLLCCVSVCRIFFSLDIIVVVVVKPQRFMILL